MTIEAVNKIEVGRYNICIWKRETGSFFGAVNLYGTGDPMLIAHADGCLTEASCFEVMYKQMHRFIEEAMVVKSALSRVKVGNEVRALQSADPHGN